LLLAHPVNPQVPGSSPGRGAKLSKTCSDAGFFIFSIGKNVTDLKLCLLNGTEQHAQINAHLQLEVCIGSVNEQLKRVL